MRCTKTLALGLLTFTAYNDGLQNPLGDTPMQEQLNQSCRITFSQTNHLIEKFDELGSILSSEVLTSEKQFSYDSKGFLSEINELGTSPKVLTFDRDEEGTITKRTRAIPGGCLRVQTYNWEPNLLKIQRVSNVDDRILFENRCAFENNLMVRETALFPRSEQIISYALHRWENNNIAETHWWNTENEEGDLKLTGITKYTYDNKIYNDEEGLQATAKYQMQSKNNPLQEVWQSTDAMGNITSESETTYEYTYNEFDRVLSSVSTSVLKDEMSQTTSKIVKTVNYSYDCEN